MGKKKEKPGILINIVERDNGHKSYIVLSLTSPLLDHGMVVPCAMTRKEAVQICGSVRVKNFERQLAEFQAGTGIDYRLGRIKG